MAEFRFGDTLRKVRKKKGLTIEDAAGDADVASDRLQRMEARDANFNRWLRDADSVAAALGVKLVDVIEESRVR